MSLPAFHTLLTDEMRGLLENPSALFSVIADEHRPVSISLPESAVHNATALQSALDNLAIENRIFLAHKATASPAVVASLRGVTAIEVASEAEFRNALQAGFAPKDIIAAGPKPNYFLSKLAAVPAVTIIVDSYGELTRLSEVLEERTATVLLRLSRSVLNQPGVTKKSRFGLDATQLEKSLKFLVSHQNLTLKGIAFHLDSQSIEERRHGVQRALKTLLDVQQRGFYEATVLDSGGGYGTDYGLSETAAAEFEATIKNMVAGQQPSITWQSRSYGLRPHGQRIDGELMGVDLPSGATGVGRLSSILNFQDETGTTIASQLRENLVELWIESGSALCAGAGMFAAEVIDVRECDGDCTVVVDAHRNQICFENSEHVGDPVLLSSKDASDPQPQAAYVAGHLCMESDFMTYRKILFPSMPQTGDILVWTYTGAYRSHFSASEAIGHPLPSRYRRTKDNLLIKDTL